MDIAFYAPLKAPHHPVPSGDRQIARLLIGALRRAGHRVRLASALCSLDVEGKRERQRRIAARARRVSAQLAHRYAAGAGGFRPALWFTYHCYHKAPDLLGPELSARLAIPYIVAEASHAARRRDGPWAEWHRRSVLAIRAADAVVALSAHDLPGLRALVAEPRLFYLKPFLAAPALARGERDGARRRLAGDLRLPWREPWILTVAMMRPGAKLASFRLLAAALARLHGRPWRLVVVGDGPAAGAVRRAYQAFPGERVRFVGAVPAPDLARFYRAADVFAWPAVREALGLAALEAQAAGLPVVAGGGRGVPELVGHGESGWLSPPGDAAAFARRLDAMLAAPRRRLAMGEAAAARARREHGFAAGGATLAAIVDGCAARARVR